MSSASDLILRRIRERGPLTVAEFMALALYHPEHGYYARASRRTGRNGDFFTSVDVGPLFGALLARQFAEMWRRLDDGQPFDLVEAGAADGRLARDVLDAAAGDPEFYAAIRLHLVEASASARRAHRDVLGPHADKLAASSATLPREIHGVLYANELLDALPVHSVVMTEHGLREQYVDADGDRLVTRVGAPSTEALAAYFDALGISLQPGWRAEVNLAALSWLARACLAVHRGYLLLIDYGHDAHELYSATHADGTLTTFQRHLPGYHRHDRVPPWLVDPGERDITSHVDLTSVRRTAEALGCTTLGLIDQGYFLLALGLADEVGAGTSTAEVKRRLALKTLMMPGGLGSTHKVLVLARHVQGPLRGLSGPSRLT